MGSLKITLKRSLAGSRPQQRATAKALGLTKLQKTVTHRDNPQIRGMIATIAHLVEVEEGADTE